jgi:hypothetical protein
MAKETDLTKTELTAPAAVDGTPAQPKMLPEIKSRLIGLYYRTPGMAQRSTFKNAQRRPSHEARK